MADITLTCTKCGKNTVVSEFIDPSAAKCSSCGAQLPPAHPTATVQLKREHVKFKPPPAPEEQVKDEIDEETPESSMWEAGSSPWEKKPKPEGKRVSRHFVYSWLVFVVVGVLMGLMRYSDGLLPQYQKDLIQYGPYVLLLFHVIIVIQAFTDVMMQGILCLFVPGYSLFYLFFLSDNFYLRGFVGGLLVGIGADSAMFYGDVALRTTGTVKDWIASGG